MDVFKKRNKVTKEEKEKVATKAGGWLRKLEKLEGRAYCEAWNKMVVEAVAQEVDDLRACDVFSFDDESVLVYRNDSALVDVREVLLPRDVSDNRTLFNWRLAGTKRLIPGLSGYLHAYFPYYMKAKSAAKRLGVSMWKLRQLCRERKLSCFGCQDFSRRFFLVSEVEFYLKRHPVPRKA